MSIAFDSSKINLNPFGVTETSGNVTTSTSSVEVYTNTQTSDSIGTTVEKEVKEDTINRNFDIDELVKKYKDDPLKVLEVLGIDYTDEQIEELKSIINDKKSLKSFLEIVKQDNLSASDIFAGIKKAATQKTSGIFSRIKNVITTAIEEGIEEAFNLAQSEQVYKASKLGSNMNDIREEREDFSSEGVANIAQTIVDTPEIKENTMHFVTKNENDGKKLYTEEDVTKATEIMAQNPQDANLFTSNAVELESIKDDNNNIKYKGSTIINVDEKMIQNKDLQSTMLNTAKKKDMTDNYLVGITDNLVENPDMKKALDEFLNMKDDKGNDRFSALNILNQTDYMADKNINIIDDYLNNTKELAIYDKLSGDNIVSISGNITDKPEIKNEVLTLIETQSVNGNEVEKYAESALVNNNNEQTQKEYTKSNTINTQTATNPIINNKSITNNVEIKSATEPEEKIFATTTTINGKVYDRNLVQNALYRKFGTSAEGILQNLEKDPRFIETIKKYGNQKVILDSIINQPGLVEKLMRSLRSVSTDDLANMLPLCTNSTMTEALIKLTSKYGATKAVSMLTEAKNNNTIDQILAILDNGTIDTSTKKTKIENINNGEKATSIFA